LGIVVAGLKLLKVLPIVWLHRRWCLTREAVFLADLEIPEDWHIGDPLHHGLD
jgi:hypothetical protein